MMRNRHSYHDFRAYGTEDIGEGIRWARVRCRKCGEERTVGAPIADVNLTGGCWRHGRDQPWRQGDHLVIDGRLDEFERMLPGDLVLSRNAGGQWYETPLADVRPQQ